MQKVTFLPVFAMKCLEEYLTLERDRPQEGF